MRYYAALPALLFGLGLLPVPAAIDSTADSPKELAQALARKASRAQKAGEFAQAYLSYSEAAALQPSNRKYRSRMEVLQGRASGQSKPRPRTGDAAADFPVLLPEDAFNSLTEKEIAQARQLNEVPSLKARPGRQNFDLNDTPRALFDKVAQSFGLETVYDGDYPPSDPRVRFHITDANYREALNDLEAATGSFVVPLSGRVFLVAKDSPAKRNDLEQTVAVSVAVPQVLTAQEITEIAQVVRQATDVQKIGFDNTHSQIVIRDRVSRVQPAISLLQQLISYRPEVMIDLEFLQMDSTDVINYGFTVTNTFSGVLLGHILNNVTTAPTGITNLLTFGGGRTLIGIGAAQVQAMFNQTIGKSNSIFHAQLRSVAGQPAVLHAGEKYPVITGGYFGPVAPSQQGQVYAPPPQFTFEDLGLEMKVTPFVHGMSEVTMAVEISFEVLTGTAVNGIPVIGNRKISSQVRLRDDEWALIGTLMNKTESKSVGGFWGLAQIPLLGALFRQTTLDKEDSNVLIGIRPHLLSLPPDQIVMQPLRVGSQNRPYTPL